ncbi:lysozyme inhibitor LprI family protein [Methylogaea oryzae]|uniref:Lysozyme inhibitor LprI-like N-terminal domain-containing protein n=1 Tax=Methylogaea oryzae TaxID=1295382 RepID=A0A8D5AII3_9GAMM|nr:lysozyme inhibitor LprI family protein [Methylogaea oryzae]BBL71381.1 hypothetical protein MoryE10_19870 [Methylogaea oryzae]
MTLYKPAISGAVLCCSLAMAAAVEAESVAPFSECMDKAAGITSAMLDCIGAETKLQDARLNKAYQALMATLPPARKQQLQEAQRAWLQYRDANCGFYADPAGGAIATVNASDCFLSATAGRAKELERLKD